MWGAQKRSKRRLKNTPCKNAFKKHPLQNRTNVQIKGGGVKGLLNNVQKNCTFFKGGLPLLPMSMLSVFCSQDSRVIGGDLEADGAMTELLCNPGCIFSRNNPFCKTFTLLLSCDQVEQNDHNLRSRLSI